MTTIVTRAGKGFPLTWDEVDANFNNLNNDKAELASPTFTGTPAAPTAAVNTNTTQVATTAFVNAEINSDRPFSDTNPVMDGTAAQGVSANISRQDHVHPSDTSRVAKAGDTMTGTLTGTLFTAPRDQLGVSATATNNFTLDASAADGTMKLARGNAGATTQDVMTVAANGGVSLKGGTVAPASGMIGEILTASGGPGDVGFGAVATNISSLSISAGVWDIQVWGSFAPSDAGCNHRQICGSLVSATLGSISNVAEWTTTAAGATSVMSGYMSRQVFTGTTVVYLVARAQGSSGTINVSGTLNARRVA